MRLETSAKSQLPTLRFGQCWQDADVLLEGLDVRPEHVCLSIASGGDNALAMLSRGPERVIAIDLNPAQIACLELKVAAFRELSHPEMLILVGSRPGTIREHLYRRCRTHLSEDAREFWDAHTTDIANGIGGAGTVEHALAKFRGSLLRFVQKDKGIERLFRGGTPEIRKRYYDRDWNNWRWKMLCSNTFNRSLIAEMGHDTLFLKKVDVKIPDRILDRLRRALTEGAPENNPYLQWLLIGRHTTALPFALRPENFESIRKNLDRLELRLISLGDFLTEQKEVSIDRMNLDNVLEPMAPETFYHILDRITRVGRPNARIAYWNMVVERHRPEDLSHRIRPMEARAAKLEQQDNTVLYTEFVLEGLV